MLWIREHNAACFFFFLFCSLVKHQSATLSSHRVASIWLIVFARCCCRSAWRRESNTRRELSSFAPHYAANVEDRESQSEGKETLDHLPPERQKQQISDTGVEHGLEWKGENEGKERRVMRRVRGWYGNRLCQEFDHKHCQVSRRGILQRLSVHFTDQLVYYPHAQPEGRMPRVCAAFRGDDAHVSLVFTLHAVPPICSRPDLKARLCEGKENLQSKSCSLFSVAVQSGDGSKHFPMKPSPPSHLYSL